MSFKWQDKHMELFLETYKQYECLWNNKCVNYSKSSEREKAYLSMLNDLNIPGLTVGDIKAKIKTIRTRYGAELAKIRNSESNLNADAGGGVAGAGEVYEPRLFWFKDADQFLRNVCTAKPISYLTKDQKECSFEQNTTQNYEGNDSTNSPENSRNSPLTTNCSTIPNSNPTARYRKNEMKRSLNNVPETVNAHKKLKPTPENEDELNEHTPNEFDYFCKSLAIQLKRMPLERAIICQEKLQNIMTKERLFQLSEPYLSSLPISFNNNNHQQLLSDDNNDIQNQSSENKPMICSTEALVQSIIENHQYEINGDEDGEDESEYVPEVKKEI